MPLQKRQSPVPLGGTGLRCSDRTGCPDHRKDTTAFSWSASYFSVHDGRTCLGHVLVGHREFRAYDAEDRPLGIFKTRDEARKAVTNSADAP